jgi:hypothetical protein
MVGSLMSDMERVKYEVIGARPPANFWVALVLAILAPFAVPSAIKNSGVAGGLFGFLFWEAIFVVWAYSAIKPYNTVKKWQEAGEYERRDWSPEERGLQRGKLLLYVYKAAKADPDERIALDEVKRAGGWTLAEMYNLITPLEDTEMIDVEMRKADNAVDRVMAFSQAKISLTPTGVLATEDAVTQARQRPGYSVTIHGNNNQVQVATVNSEQLRNT